MSDTYKKASSTIDTKDWYRIGTKLVPIDSENEGAISGLLILNEISVQKSALPQNNSFSTTWLPREVLTNYFPTTSKPVAINNKRVNRFMHNGNFFYYYIGPVILDRCSATLRQ